MRQSNWEREYHCEVKDPRIFDSIDELTRYLHLGSTGKGVFSKFNCAIRNVLEYTRPSKDKYIPYFSKHCQAGFSTVPLFIHTNKIISSICLRRDISLKNTNLIVTVHVIMETNRPE